MNAAKYEKWESFHRLAMSYFNHLGQAGDLELVIESVSEQISALKIYKALNHQVMIEQMIWDSGQDFKKFQQAQVNNQFILSEFTPTIFTQTYPLNPEDYQNFPTFTQGLAFPMPAPPKPENVILDGTRYELRLHHHTGKVNLSWHSNLPEEWYALKPLLDEMEELQMRFFAEFIKK